MPAPYFHASATFLAPAVPSGTSYLGGILITGVIGLVAAIRVLRRPAIEWPHGVSSKIGWILVILYVAIPLGGYPIPLGAAAALWHTRRRPSARPAQLRYADGESWGK